MADLTRGTEFAGCRIEEVVGSGGMGVIYRATELRLGRPVALKLIAADRASDPAVRERFEREARLTASIDHPNVIPVYGAGEEDGHLYLVMRYVPGTDLHALLRREGRLEPARAARVIAQVAGALDAAHAAGLVHRDVKPANVLIAGDHVYLGDFGITRVQEAEASITESGGWIGTVDFMAPEHLRGEPTDARSDVYALGCVLHAALTGTPPFRRATVPATITAHLHEAPPRPSDTAGVPAAFDAVVARALAKDPAARYASAGDLGRAAVAAAAGEAAALARGSVARGEAAPDHDAETAVVSPPGGARTSAPTAVAPTAVAPTAVAPTSVAPGADAPAEADREPRVDREPLHADREPSREDHGRPAAERPPPSPRVHRSRRRRLAKLVSWLVLALPAITVLVLVTRDDGRDGPLRAGEVEELARGFARAYGDEDTRSLRRLLTPGVRRVGTTDVQTGRGAVVGEYRRQFAADAVGSYRLADLDVTGGRVGRAEGRYTVTRRGRPALTGRLVLGVVRRAGEPRIDLIATEPRG
jgi:serine/threonine-protein kinase